MRIPLDYYRILGLPIQATADQLQQAHRDRTLQLPRREYSEAAIAARKQLLDEAYAILSNPEQRQSYDVGFLSKTCESSAATGLTATGSESLAQAVTEAGTADPYTPSIEIQDSQFMGALLVLLELGEYELVLKLGRPYLGSGSTNLKNGRFGDPKIAYSDIVLTVALACLELGREQWQQGQYENATEALETGQELLLREGLFAGVRGEIQADLYKLRPYRVLELLAHPEDHWAERRQGLRLLQDMLQERGGIDGSGNDQSGLNIDDFLRFIQQLRSYLTAEEQQALFEEEARRPSAVATYLAVYALLARGFAQQKPALIRRAKVMLIRLGSRQDVHLEQAVCSLLLGQTEEASRALELSQEYEPLAFIREHSKGSPDLLPGLCLYAERWLQDEVFPHFRDLVNQAATLKDYFANEQVQAYLEELPAEPDAISESWAPPAAQQAAANWQAGSAQRVPVTTAAAAAAEVGNGRPSNRFVVPEGVASRSGTATLHSMAGRSATAASTATMPAAERVTTPIAEREVGAGGQGFGDHSRRRSDRGRAAGNTATVVGAIRTEEIPRRRPSRSAIPAESAEGSGSSRRILFIGAGLLALAALLGFGLSRLMKQSWQTARTAPSPSLLIQLDRPVINLPSEVEATPSLDGAFNEAAATQVIQAWLTAKKEAMGPNYSTEKLNEILADPKLSEWQRWSEEAKRDGWYKEYDHTLKVSSVEVSKTNPDQATARAVVTEVTRYYRGNQIGDTQTDNLEIRYKLIRISNQWRIQDWTVL